MSGNQSPTCIVRTIESVLDDSQYTGEINLTGRKLKYFPKNAAKFDLSDTNKAELSHNQFADVPEEVCSFNSLEHLNLSHNQIRILPFSLTKLHELVELNLSNNLLTSFPPFICQLHHLQVLIMNGNKIISLPDEIGQLMKLSSLQKPAKRQTAIAKNNKVIEDMSSNELTNIPNQLGELYSLKDLKLRRNQLIELPICLTRLKLNRLDISCNKIAHIPCDFRKVTSLEEILVEGNPLVSPPAHLCLRGLIHIMKFLHKEATKHEHQHRSASTSSGSIQRRLKRSSSFSAASDSRLGNFDRNRSYNPGHGFAMFGRNPVTMLEAGAAGGGSLLDSKMRSQKFDLMTSENMTSAPSKTAAPIQDVCSTISNSLAGLSLTRNLFITSTCLPSRPSTSNLPNNANTAAVPECININIGRHNNNNASSNVNAADIIVTNNNNHVQFTTKPNNDTPTCNANISASGKSLSTQANAASQELEMWLNGINAKNLKSSEGKMKSIESPDILNKESLKQKAEMEMRRKKMEVLKSKLEITRSDSEKNILIQQYHAEMKSEAVGAGSLSGIVNDRLSQPPPYGMSNPISAISSSSSSQISSSATWSNSNTLPRCGPIKEAFDQSLAKQKMRLPGLKIPTFRKSVEEGEGSKSTSGGLKDSKSGQSQVKMSTSRMNGVSAPDGRNGTSKPELVSNGIKSGLNEREKSQVEKMRKNLESLLKLSLPAENLETLLKDGVILCHLVNHLKPRSVSCIHVSSQSAPVLSMPKIRRNVENFILACKRLGLDQTNICSPSSIVDDFNIVSLSSTVNSLISTFSRTTQ